MTSVATQASKLSRNLSQNPNSDSRRAIAYLASPVAEASIPLLPSQWAAAAVEGRGDLAVHERAMIQAVRPALRPRLVPGPRCGRPCWPGQVWIDDCATGATMLSCSANRPMRPLA